MRVGYARSLGGPDKGGDLQCQVEALHAHGCTEVIVETADATEQAAPKLDEALQKARPGDVLVIHALAALAVSTNVFIATMLLLQRAGIGLISITDGLDTTSADGGAVYALVGVLSALFDEQGKPRRSKQAKAKKSARSGRPKALSQEEFELAKRLITKTNMTMAEIAERLGVAPATLYRYFPGGRNAVSDDG
jgi:DNA invertase Pin-like site-specific DNA recombinase